MRSGRGPVAYVRAQRGAVRAVAPELRSWWLLLPAVAPRRPRPGPGLRVARRLLSRSTEPGADVRLERRVVDGEAGGPPVEVVLYEPAGRARPSGALLWVHGGGMVAGGPEQDHDVCGLLATGAGVLVASVAYRLAPEHPYPAGLADCAAALAWLDRAAADLGVDRRRVAVGGASAGAAIAASLAQRAHDAGRPLALQLLLYPMLDDRTVLRDVPDGPRGRIGWTPATNRFGWSAYLGHPPGPGPVPPYAVPARRDDLAGLPPAWIGVGSLDLLLDECVEYAGRLRRAGVACALHVEPGMFHAADVGSGAPSMVAFRARAVAAVRDALGAPPEAQLPGAATPR